MEETLGKRIISNRKRLGMTQDKLAEQLGVTAQAVSKWENDQSCPDISILPKLAEIFGISVDALLGVTADTQAAEAEVVESVPVEETEPDGVHFQNGNWEFRWDGGRKSYVWFAIWVLLMGSMMLYNVLMHQQVGLWDMAWPSALLLFGLSGFVRRFSFFRLGCALFGGYSLLENMQFTFLGLSSQLLITIAVLLLGMSLLIDAMRKPKGQQFAFFRNGKKIKHSRCEVQDEVLACNLAFCEVNTVIDTPRLRGGNVSVSFGELEIDLSGCEEIAPGCIIEAECAFGELTVKVPRRYRVEADANTAFGNFEVKGFPDSEPEAIISLDASASFGEICVKYI